MTVRLHRVTDRELCGNCGSFEYEPKHRCKLGIQQAVPLMTPCGAFARRVPVMPRPDEPDSQETGDAH